MLLLRGAMVWTGAGELHDAGTVAVDDVINLSGATLLPGFQDGHVHPIPGGLRRIGCDLTDVATDGMGYAAVAADYARSHPDAAWITGGGWLMPHFPGGLPRKETLDEVVAQRP